MRVFIRTPYSLEKNLGKAYNEEMAMIPDGDAACFIDGDCMFLNSNYGTILHNYANEHQDSILTCWINRIHPLATGQLFPGIADWTVQQCLEQADKIKDLTCTTLLTGSVSGTLMIVPKKIWDRYKFCEVNTYRPSEPNLLGCDNHYTNLVRGNGVKVKRMNGLLIYHQYRLLTGKKDHLL
jgi:hypothetical protein